MDPITAGALVSGAVGLIGGERANRQNRQEAQRNRDFSSREAGINRTFQEKMRNSEWQAAVADMQAAGINPALAYARGGASAPGGSMASGSQAAPAMDTVSSAIGAVQAQQQRKLMAEQIRKTTGEADMAGAMGDREKARNLAYGITITPAGTGIDVSMPGLYAETQAGIRAKIAEAARADSMSAIAGMGGQIAQGFGNVMPAFESVMGTVGKGADSLASVINLLERGMRMRDDAVRSAFGMSKQALERLLRSLRSN